MPINYEGREKSMTDTTLAYTRRGHGKTIVFVHGYFGGAGHWTDQVAYFSKNYDVIAPNLAGFGDSAHLAAPDRIEGHAALIWQTLDSLGIDQIYLLGHSMGGMIVQQMTAMQPARVSKLVAYGTGPVGSLPGRFETLDESRRRIVEDGTEATMRRIAATWLVDGEVSKGYAACLAEGIKGTQQAALASLDAWEYWNGVDALSSIMAPSLVVWGDKDRSYPRSQIDALLAGIPNSRLALMPGCSHAAHLEDPDQFNALLDEFFAE